MNRGGGFRRPDRAVTVDAEPQPKPARGRVKDSGPTQKVRQYVRDRSGGWCEWSGCGNAATDIHHRLNRKAGGRHGETRRRINQPGWLLHVCRSHHMVVTNPVGEVRVTVVAMGWVLLEGEDARVVPVQTRHHPGPVLLDDAGDWSPAKG